jgi:hypothetical protein
MFECDSTFPENGRLLTTLSRRFLPETGPSRKKRSTANQHAFRITTILTPDGSASSIENMFGRKHFKVRTRQLAVTIPLALFAASEARACTEIRASTTISEPGEYCLIADFSVADEKANGITVAADHVTIDFHGFTVTGPGPRSRGIGIYATGVKDLRLSGGGATGFLYGIKIDSSSPAQAASQIAIEGMDLSGNSFRGITVSAQRAVIKKNRIDGIHGFSDWPSSHSFGIEVNGAGCEIRNNFIRDISPLREGEGVGISIDDNDNCIVRDNLIQLAPVEYGRTFGIWIGGTSSAGRTVTGNVIIGGDYGVLGWWNAAKANYIRNACDSVSHDSEYVGSNDYNQVGACRKTVAELRSAVAKDARNALLHFALARELNDLIEGDAEAKAEFEVACEQGLEEGCRQRDILAK